MAGAVSKCQRSGASRATCLCPGCYDYRQCLVKRVNGKWCSQHDLDIMAVAQAPADPTYCAECGPGRCDGSNQTCTLESYYANPANGPRPQATAQNPAPSGTAQNPPGFFGYTWPGYRYGDDSPPTERVPVAPAKCECGTGDHTRSGAHSHWCPMWVAP